ncbi:MAG: anti-sigma factor family protein [Bacteroidota bacterium]
MNCSEVHRNLIFYLEGSLDEGVSKSVEEHLGLCGDCAAFADMMRKSLDVIEREKKITETEDKDFTDRVLKTFNSGKDTVNIPVYNILRYAAAAAVIVFGIFTGINIAKVASVPGEYGTGELSDEAYYLNDMYQEPIESFFLLKHEENE